MNTSNTSCQRAMVIAGKYLSDLEQLPINTVILKMEDVAYTLARNGETKEAASLFIAIAELEKAKSDSG